jgi:CRISPR system Cascade subunit CasD
MSVLLLRLAGPMQSWGTQSRFSHRDTGLEPSKSGVVGLLSAALGWPRDQEEFDIGGRRFRLEAFARGLLMTVRVDRPGRLMRDYHTAQNLPSQEAVPSERYFLADADFLVGLEGERSILERLDAALHKPVWVLSLGRKSFVPSLPISEGIHDGKLLDVLMRHDRAGEKSVHPHCYVIEVPFGEGEPRADVPLSFVSRDRKFAVRHVKTEYYPIPKPDSESSDVPQ